MESQAIESIKQYYDNFNNQKLDEFFSLLTDDVVHDINHGRQEIGKKAFRAFMERMNRHYREKAVELVAFTNDTGTRGAAEFFIEGTYLSTDEGLPPARGQTYRLRCGAFFDFKNGKISRVTNYYNLNDWLSQVK